MTNLVNRCENRQIQQTESGCETVLEMFAGFEKEVAEVIGSGELPKESPEKALDAAHHAFELSRNGLVYQPRKMNCTLDIDEINETIMMIKDTDGN